MKSLSEAFPNNETLNMQEVISNIQAIHPNFGGIILDRWGFNRDFIEISQQHEKEAFPEAVEKAVLIVSLANRLTRRLGYSLFEDDMELSETEPAKRLYLRTETLNTILEETERIMQDSGCFN